VQTLAKVKSRLVDGFLGRLGPKIQVVAGSAALETLERITCEIRRERAVFPVFGSFVKRTRAADLVARPSKYVKPKQLQDLGHRYVGPKLAKIDPWHGLPLHRNREEEPVFQSLVSTGSPDRQRAEFHEPKMDVFRGNNRVKTGFIGDFYPLQDTKSREN